MGVWAHMRADSLVPHVAAPVATTVPVGAMIRLCPSRVDVAIDYTIRTTNELFNLVFPLYVQEGVG